MGGSPLAERRRSCAWPAALACRRRLPVRSSPSQPVDQLSPPPLPPRMSREDPALGPKLEWREYSFMRNPGAAALQDSVFALEVCPVSGRWRQREAWRALLRALPVCLPAAVAVGTGRPACCPAAPRPCHTAGRCDRRVRRQRRGGTRRPAEAAPERPAADGAVGTGPGSRGQGAAAERRHPAAV